MKRSVPSAVNVEDLLTYEKGKVRDILAGLLRLDALNISG